MTKKSVINYTLASLLALLSLAAPAAAQNPFSLVNFGSTAVSTNSGNKDGGTLRIVWATDSPSPTATFKVDLSGTGANSTAILVTGSAVDNATVTESVSTFAPAGGEVQTTPGTVTTGHQAMVALTTHRAFQVSLFDTSGTAITATSDATTNTTTQTSGPQIFCNGSTATPTAVGADGRSIASWCGPNGQSYVNLWGVGGSAIATGHGTASGSIRVELPTDGTGVVGLNAGTAIIGKVGIDQTTPGTTNGIRPDTSGATGAAPPARADFVGGLGAGATGGFVIGVPVCDSVKAVSVTSATTQLMVTGVSGRHVRICSVSLVTAIANNIAFISGTGATCGTGTAGMAGGTTAANGYNFAANGGITLGSGVGTVMQTVATGDSVCLITSAAGPLAGTIAYTIY